MRKLKTGLASEVRVTRGWPHIGVINALRWTDIEIGIVTGCSIGSLVGATYACSRLPTLESWICSFSNWDALKPMDLLWRRGGLLRGEEVSNHHRRIMPVTDTERCEHRFATVATNLSIGRKLWFTEGDLHLAVRVSCNMSGLMAPVRHNGYQLVGDAMVNPVPVSLTRIMGADIAIAADLQHDAHLMRQDLFFLETPRPEAEEKEGPRYIRLRARLTQMNSRHTAVTPTVMEIITTSIQIPGNRLKCNHMAGGLPDTLLQPCYPQVPTPDFHRVGKVIATDQLAVEKKIGELLPLMRTAA